MIFSTLSTHLVGLWFLIWTTLIHNTLKVLKSLVGKSLCTYALRAPPPLACPSSLVTITDATSTLALNARACYKEIQHCLTLLCFYAIKINVG